MPLGIALSIFSINNILASIWARIFMKEPISRMNIFLIIVSFLGVIMINDPFDSQTIDFEDKSSFIIGTVIEIIAAVAFSIGIVLIRYMKSNIHYCILPFY